MHRAVGLWQAIMMLLLMSGLVVVVLKFASVGARHTADAYVREQAELYLNSAIEQALLAISGHDRSSGGCLWSFSAPTVSNHGKIYTGQITMERYYLLNGSQDFTDCGGTADPRITAIQSEESHGMVIMQIEVNASIDGEETVRLLRRSLQRP